MSKLRYLILIFLISAAAGAFFWEYGEDRVRQRNDSSSEYQAEQASPTPTPTISPTNTPTASPTAVMSFARMNELYGPCASVPVLMYHHVDTPENATEKGFASLNVTTEMFEKHLSYLQDKGYQTIFPQDLKVFFEGGSLPKKGVMLTFDDGYADNGEEMYQLLKKYEARAVVFLATGLMNNGGYLSWEKISEMAGSGQVEFGNHTWSHRNMGASQSVIDYELTTADSQLSEKGLNGGKTFAYPYGLESGRSIKTLESLGYNMAFTTQNGKIQCSKKRFDLPRIRIGNAPLSAYGL